MFMSLFNRALRAVAVPFVPSVPFIARPAGKTSAIASVASVAAIAAFAAPAHATTSLILDAPGCTSGGALTWNAAGKMLYCAGGTPPANTLGIIVAGCAANTAFTINPQTLTGSCVASSGAAATTTVPITVSLPDCIAGMVSWNATTGTLTCRLATQILNVDGSTATVYDSLTDGLLVMRYMFGIRGTALTANALSATATRTTPEAVVAYLDSIRASLDIDNNGSVDALTDGTLILRYMFGARGTALTANAVGNGANPGTSTAIEAKLHSLMP